MKRIVIVLGTMPEAVKLAPVILALKEDDRFDPVVVSTGQHREMLDITLRQFNVEPDLDLDIMTEQQTLSEVTARIMTGMSQQPGLLDADAVVVHGDTATTLAGALVGFQHRVPVIHVEAGLRSGELFSPFPEEGNRRLVAQIASLHLAPTQGNRANLIREGISEDQIVVTGNTVVDAVRWGSEAADDYGDPALDDLTDDSRFIVLASAHRRESWGEPMKEIAAAVAEIAEHPRVRVVVPMHLNPAVREVMMPKLENLPNVTVVDPLPYLPFCRLMLRSDIIVSDSSGAEEEGPALGKPTLVLRDRSERHEAIRFGAARLVGRRQRSIVAAVHEELQDREDNVKPTAKNPYGDGRATDRVIAAMARHLFEGAPAAPLFDPVHELEGVA